MIYLLVLTIALMSAAAEAVSYLGFVLKHTGVSAYLIYTVSVAVAIYVKSYPRFVKPLLRIAAFGTAAAFLILSFLEVTHYNNYVYTISHVNLVSFQFLISLIFVHYVLVADRLPPLTRLAKGLLIGILVCVGLDGLGRTSAFARKSIESMMRAPFATYEEKMITAYPDLYPAMQEVVRLTPPDATILIPPQGNPWEYEGNGAFVTYFIYPRLAVNLTASGTLPPISGPTYVLISHGTWPELTNPMGYGWPKVPIKSKKIWQIDSTTRLSTEYDRDYDPTRDNWTWGLIEVTHE